MTLQTATKAPPCPPNDKSGAMTPENALELLRIEQANPDTEAAHINADDIICRLLVALGHHEVAHEFDKVDKWFA